MRAELEELNSRLGSMSGEEKDLLIRRLLEENAEMKARLEVASSAAAELAVQFQQVKAEKTALEKDKKELIRQNRNLTDQLQKRKKDLFGRKSEQSTGIIDSIFDEDPSRRSVPRQPPLSKRQSMRMAPESPADIRPVENGRRISIHFRQEQSMTSMPMP